MFRQLLNFKALSLGLTGVFLLAFIMVSGCVPAIPKFIPPELVREQPASEVMESSLKPPEIELYVLDSFSRGELKVSVSARIVNPNSFVIGVGDLQVIARGETGFEYAQDAIPLDSMEAYASRTITRSIALPTDVLIEGKIIISVAGKIVHSGNTVPFSTSVAANVPSTTWQVATQAVSLRGSIGRLTTGGLETTVEVTVKAPTLRSLNMGTTQMIVRGRSGREIMRVQVPGGSVEANSTRTFTRDFVMPLEALEETPVTIDSEAMAQVGVNTFSVRSSIKLQTPLVSELIPSPKMTVERYDMDWIGGSNTYDLNNPLAVSPLYLSIYATISNDSDFNMVSRDLQVKIYQPDGTLAGSGFIFGSPVPAKSAKTFSGKFYVENIGFIGTKSTVKINTYLDMEKTKSGFPLSASMVFTVN